MHPSEFTDLQPPPQGAATLGNMCVSIDAFSRRLDAVKRSRVVIVVGASGSGRQSALLAWARDARRELMTIRVDRVSQEGLQFASSGGVSLPAAATSFESDSLVTWHDTVFQALGADSAVSLVIDGFEQVGMSEDFDAFITGLVRHVSGRSSVFLLTHQFDIAQRAWADHPRVVSVIDWEDIAITGAEALAIARQHGSPSSHLVSGWLREMHGWMFGVCLLVQSKFTYAAPRMGLPRPVHQFIKARIFDRLPADFQALLKTAAMVAVIDARACEKLGVVDGEKMLGKHARSCFGMVRRNALDGLHYTLHPVFRRFLWGELVEELGAEQASALTDSVATSLGESGVDASPSVEILIASGRYAEVAKYIEDHVAKTPFDLRVEAAGHMLATLPEGEELQHPGLAYWRAWVVRPTEVARSKALYMAAADGFLRLGDLPRAFNSWGWAATLIGMRFGAGRELDASIAWVESYELQATEDNWFLPFPRLCCTVAVILAMRRPRSKQSKDWTRRALDSLALNSTQSVGGLVLVGLAAALLKDLDSVRLDVLEGWCRSANDQLIGPDVEGVRTLVRVASLIATGQMTTASAAMSSTPLPSGKMGGIPVSDAFLLLGAPWLGVSPGGLAQAHFEPFMKWNSSTSDFYCLKLLAVAHDDMAAGNQLSANEAMAMAYSLSANIEFSFVSEFTLLCAAQHACLSGSWDTVASLLEQLEQIKRPEEPCPLLDMQEGIVRAWAGACVSTDPTDRAELLEVLADLRVGSQGAFLINPALALQISAAMSERSEQQPAPHVPSHDPSPAPASNAVLNVRDRLPSWQAGDAVDAVIRVATFGPLRIEVRDASGLWKPTEVQTKLETLLRMLLLRVPGDKLSIADICDEMWPESEGDAAKRNFDSAVHRLRKSLGYPEAIVLKNAKLSLNLHLVQVDLHDVLRVTESAISGVGDLAQASNKVLETVTGSLSLLDPEISIVRSFQRRRGAELRSALARLAAMCKAQGLPDLAIELHGRVVQYLDGDFEVLHAWIQLLIEAGRLDEARYMLSLHGEERVRPGHGPAIEKLQALIEARR